MDPCAVVRPTPRPSCPLLQYGVKPGPLQVPDTLLPFTAIRLAGPYSWLLHYGRAGYTRCALPKRDVHPTAVRCCVRLLRCLPVLITTPPLLRMAVAPSVYTRDHYCSGLPAAYLWLWVTFDWVRVCCPLHTLVPSAVLYRLAEPHTVCGCGYGAGSPPAVLVR